MTQTNLQQRRIRQCGENNNPCTVQLEMAGFMQFVAVFSARYTGP